MNELYWITRLDYIKDTVSIFIMLSVLLFILCFWVYIASDADEDTKKSGKFASLVFAVILAFLLLAYIFIPSSNDVYMMFGIDKVNKELIEK